jgi:hypothetical protein
MLAKTKCYSTAISLLIFCSRFANMLSKPALRLIFFSVFIFFAPYLRAQPVLPDIVGATDKGINVLSWFCQYEGIKSIAVQRSSDSMYNYVTVGYVKNLKKGPQAFIDGHPVAKDNWYRLYIVFNSDLTWFSNRFKLYVDSVTIMNKGVLPPNDSLQKLAARVRVDSTVVKRHNMTVTSDTGGEKAYTIDSLYQDAPKLTITIPEPEEINAYTYVKSQFVFTNPFTGHVNLEIPDVNAHHYSVKFFDSKDKEIMDLPRIVDPQIIIDKRNFQKKGLYKFELRQDRKKLETGYITIY